MIIHLDYSLLTLFSLLKMYIHIHTYIITHKLHYIVINTRSCTHSHIILLTFTHLYLTFVQTHSKSLFEGNKIFNQWMLTSFYLEDVLDTFYISKDGTAESFCFSIISFYK